MHTGSDDDGDSILDDEEVDATEYVCNGSDGSDGNPGTDVVADTQAEPAGSNCPFGGTRIRTGLDANDDGVLDDAEVVRVVFVCNPSDGTPTVGSTRYEPPGSNCEKGGVAIESGLDDDLDGVLDPSEITSTTFLCNDHVPTFEVIDGNFTLRTSFDAALVAGTRLITGALLIRPDPGLETIVIPALEQVDAGIVVDSSSTIETLEMPALVSVEHLQIGGVPQLELVSMPALTIITGPAPASISIGNAPRLPRCHITDLFIQTGFAGTVPTNLPPCETIDRCRLVAPLDEVVASGTAIEVSGRVRVVGVTDQTTGIDSTVVQRSAVGSGAAGTDPTSDPSWVFTIAQPRSGWNDIPAVGFDEYLATIGPSIGFHDVAVRFSGDAGRSWTYCDRDAGAGSDGSEDGYQPANAGHVEVQ